MHINNNNIIIISRCLKILFLVFIAAMFTSAVIAQSPQTGQTTCYDIAGNVIGGCAIDIWGGGSESIALMSDGTVWT